MKAPSILVLILLIAGCSTTPTPEQLMSAARAAVDNPARSEKDRELDARRKPADVVAFFGITEGMKVVDVFAGGGYYSEIISYVVGPEGGVTLYNNNPWDEFVSKAVEKRLEGNRLPNVERLTVPPSGLADVEPGYDAAIFILGMHDLYYEDMENHWPAINIAEFLGNIHRIVKPGGVFGIIDHNAAAGADPAEVGKSLHRVDPAVIIRDVEAAGFVLEASSDVLANPGDDHTGLVFAPELRWKSDRSVLRFRKK